MEKILEWIIVGEDFEEIFEDEFTAMQAFKEIWNEDPSKIDQFFKKTWIKLEDDYENEEEDYQEYDVEVFYTKTSETNYNEYPEFRNPVLDITEEQFELVKNNPNFHDSGSIEGMIENVYEEETFLVAFENYIYKVSNETYESFINELY